MTIVAIARLLSSGFRPFFFLAAAWAALGVPVWLPAYVHGYAPRADLPAMFWHAHEMVYGFGFAAVAAFMLTAIPNWTGRLPVRGSSLAALGLLVAGVIALVGGRIVPSFTRNWLAKRNAPRMPAPESSLDRVALLITLAVLGAWVSNLATWPALVAGAALGLRLARWRGLATVREPLLFILHIGYGWLALGLVFLGLEVQPQAALHALTAGAIGTMTLAVMTRDSLGDAGRATLPICALVTLAALFRVSSPFAGAAIHYGRFLVQARA